MCETAWILTGLCALLCATNLWSIYELMKTDKKNLDLIIENLKLEYEVVFK